MTLERWQFLNPKGVIVACSWCLKEHGIPPRLGDSHGICPDHKRRELAKIGIGVARDADGVARPVAVPVEERRAAA